MKRNIILMSLVIIAAFFSYQVESLEFALITLIFLSAIFLILAGMVNVFRKVKSKHFTVPLFVIGISLTGVLVSLFRPYDAAILESGSMSEKLEYAFKTDQKDRMQLKSYILNDMGGRDEVRLHQVRTFYRQEKELKPIDKFHAAFIYHHSDNSKDYAIASKLATAAANAPELQENYQVQWLSKAAYDRWMLSLGKPEKYNTQDKFSIDFE